MNKHTPGPWQKAEPFASVKAPGRPCIADCGSRSDLTAQANARLIAAAPDLLAACEAALESEVCVCADIADGDSAGACLACVLFAAIAKARGA